MRQLSIALALVGSLVMAACAAGVSDGPPGSHPDARISTGPDANFNQPADAPVFSQPDAFVGGTPDAFIPIPDAPVQSGFCNGDSDCNVGAGECCFTLGSPPGICVANTSPIPGLCLP